jgi:hypothetical protein
MAYEKTTDIKALRRLAKAAASDRVIQVGDQIMSGVDGTFIMGDGSVVTLVSGVVTVIGSIITITGDIETIDTTPTWSWTAAVSVLGYRYSYDNATWTPTAAETFTPDTPLALGPYTLYVQGEISSGVWSRSASLTINISEIGLPSEANIVAGYFMNDNAATTVVSAAFGSDGTSVANTADRTVAGKVNTALSFNGTDDEIRCSAGDCPLANAARSIETWIYFDSVAGEQAILGYGDEVGLDYNGIYLTEAKFTFNNFSVPITLCDDEVVTSTWYHVIFTYDGTNWRSYVNGALKEYGTNADWGGELTTTDLPLVVGNLPITAGYWLDGNVDILRVYDTALTLGNVVALYNSDAGIEDLTP